MWHSSTFMIYLWLHYTTHSQMRRLTLKNSLLLHRHTMLHKRKSHRGNTLKHAQLSGRTQFVGSFACISFKPDVYFNFWCQSMINCHYYLLQCNVAVILQLSGPLLELPLFKKTFLIWCFGDGSGDHIHPKSLINAPLGWSDQKCHNNPQFSLKSLETDKSKTRKKSKK